MQRIILLFMVLTSLAYATEYDDVLQQMNELVATHPDYVQLFDIGTNDQGDTIYGLRIENTLVEVVDNKPKQLVVGAHHGNERTTTDLALVFAEDLLQSICDINDPYYTPLSEYVFYIIPVLNISGFNTNTRSELNGNGVYIDPNRDYEDACANNAYFQLASTSNLAAFIDANNIVGAVTLHGYIGTFTYPWGMYTADTHTLDHELYDYIATQAVEANSYLTGTHSDVIYPATGSFEDWAYHKYGIWVILLEMSYSANLQQDSLALLIYFSLIPGERSEQHAHTGQCTRTWVANEEYSRP